MTRQVSIRATPRDDIDLDKLARAALAVARQQMSAAKPKRKRRKGAPKESRHD
jgi:hypothetical protein